VKFRHKREVTGWWRQLHNEKLYNLYSTRFYQGACRPKSRDQNSYENLVGKPKWERSVGRSRRRWSNIKMNLAGFEVLTAVVMKSIIFWDITLCSPLSVDWRFGGTYRLHHQGRKISWARNQRESRWQEGGFHAGFFLSLFSGPEDGGDMILRNVGWHSAHYKALYPRR
jgi:hypothetical protein